MDKIIEDKIKEAKGVETTEVVEHPDVTAYKNAIITAVYHKYTLRDLYTMKHKEDPTLKTVEGSEVEEEAYTLNRSERRFLQRLEKRAAKKEARK